MHQLIKFNLCTQFVNLQATFCTHKTYKHIHTLKININNKICHNRVWVCGLSCASQCCQVMTSDICLVSGEVPQVKAVNVKGTVLNQHITSQDTSSYRKRQNRQTASGRFNHLKKSTTIVIFLFEDGLVKNMDMHFSIFFSFFVLLSNSIGC